MCLVSKKLFPSVTTSDTECYRIVTKHDNEYYSLMRVARIGHNDDGSLEGLIQNADGHMQRNVGHVIFNEEGNPTFEEQSWEEATDNDSDLVSVVKEGYIHSFKTPNDIEKCCILRAPYDQLGQIKGNMRIYKCIIPSGTVYYSGYSYGLRGSNTYDSYASRCVKYIEDVTDELINKVQVEITDNETKD